MNNTGKYSLIASWIEVPQNGDDINHISNQVINGAKRKLV